jgi:hypothetical protein
MLKWNFLLVTLLLALGILYFGPAHAKRTHPNGAAARTPTVACATSAYRAATS